MDEKRKNRYIPINKGHFILDTHERSRIFSMKLAAGWEEEYRTYRRLWVDLPHKGEISDYPLLLDLELSSICNLSCPMCYTITDEFRRKVKKGLMDFALIKKIIDEVAGKVYALRLSLRGEPTLHPGLIETIVYAKTKRIKEVSFLTNGSKLDFDYFAELAEAGIDWITISIDGINGEYNRIRKPLTFKDTLAKLKAIKAYKEQFSLSKPVIKVQGIWPSIRPNPTRYYATLAPVTDLVAYNPLIDYLRKDREIVYQKKFSCPQIYQRLVVGSDGQAIMCANDEDGEEVIGDANKQSIYDIWHSARINEIRRVHNHPDGFKRISTCRLCYYPRKAEPNEQAIVGDREVWIENYINRRQEVGQ